MKCSSSQKGPTACSRRGRQGVAKVPTKNKKKNDQMKRLKDAFPLAKVRHAINTLAVVEDNKIYFWLFHSLNDLRKSALCILNQASKPEREAFEVAWENAVSNFCHNYDNTKPSDRYSWLRCHILRVLWKARPSVKHTSKAFDKCFQKMDYELNNEFKSTAVPPCGNGKQLRDDDRNAGCKTGDDVHNYKEAAVPTRGIGKQKFDNTLDQAKAEKKAKVEQKAKAVSVPKARSCQMDAEMKKCEAEYPCTQCDDDNEIGMGLSECICNTLEWKQEALRYKIYQKEMAAILLRSEDM